MIRHDRKFAQAGSPPLDGTKWESDRKASRFAVGRRLAGGRVRSVGRGYFLLVGWFLGVAGGLVGETLGEDWPQILGPQRNGVAQNQTLTDRFSSGQLRPRFQVDLGSGFAGPAVSGETVVVFHRQDRRELLEAYDVNSGNRRWEASFPAEYQGGYNPDSGPRCVPLIHNGWVYALGASGRLHCVNFQDGTSRWSRNLSRDYEAPEGYFGIGSTPVVAGDLLLVNIGGRRGAGVVALDLATGESRWTATDEQVSYSSPVLADFHGQSQALFLTRLSLLSLHPESGEELFSHPFGQRGLTVTGAMPVVFDNRVFLTASYNIGAEVVEIGAGGNVQSLWKNDVTLSSQYTTAVHHEGHLYGNHGREDSPQRAELRCVEAATGRVRWSRPDVGMAHLILVPPKLLVLEIQSGDLALLRATPQGYVELDRRNITNDVARPLPALVDGTLYFRANSERGDRSQLIALPLQ